MVSSQACRQIANKRIEEPYTSTVGEANTHKAMLNTNDGVNATGINKARISAVLRGIKPSAGGINGNMLNLVVMAKAIKAKKKPIVFKTALSPDDLFKKAISTSIKGSKIKSAKK